MAVHAQSGLTCTYGANNSCSSEEYCVNKDIGFATCHPRFTNQMITVDFPYSSGVDVICDQGVLSPDGNSHTFLNTAFALDLQSDRSQPFVPVHSGVKGQVAVYGECTTVNDGCGGGFGNSVKVFTEDGFLISYAHLEEVWVTQGEIVEVGQPLGLEGYTGMVGAGNRHLHLSVHHDWRALGYAYWSQVGYLPPSVPFLIKACLETQNCNPDCEAKIVDVRKLPSLRKNGYSPFLCRG